MSDKLREIAGDFINKHFDAHGDFEWQEAEFALWQLLNRLVPTPLTWSEEPPDEPGRWWCRDDDNRPFIVEFAIGIRGKLVDRDGAAPRFYGDGDCEWAGPIPYPDEPT